MSPRVTISCPFLIHTHGDDDICGEKMVVKMSRALPGTMYSPPEPSDIIDVEGDCPHVRHVNEGTLSDGKIWEALEERARDYYHERD